MSVGAVWTAEQRAREAELDWATVEILDDATLKTRLYCAAGTERPRPLPDRVCLHTERKKPGGARSRRL